MEGNETKELLKELWEKNERIFKFIFYTLFSEDKFEIEEVVEKALREKVLCLTKTMTRYRVIGQDDEKAVPLSVASVYVFKAWLKKNKNATLADLRNTFTVEECAPGYKNTYQWLFYEKNKIEELFKKWKKEGKTYVVAGNILGETDDRVKNANKYLTWDFFQEGCSGYKDYVLEVKDEKNGKIEVLSMKDWVKDWVKRFLDKAKREGIEVEEVYKTKKR